MTTAWLADRIEAGEVGTPGGIVLLESDEDVLLYDTGHIPGAQKIDWHTDLNDPVTRDYVDGEAFATVLGSRGIGRDTTVVIYGDKSNWWAAYALWVFSLFGHEDVRLLDGGRAKWVAEERELTREVPEPAAADYPVVERDDAPIRAYQADVLAHLGQPLVDVRSPGEYSGELLHMPDYPQEGAMRGGHIPGAKSVPWAKAANEDGTFKARAELEALYQGEQGLTPSDEVVAYCRIGERSSHTWFVLTHLLGFEHVRNYDGSWTEWGNSVASPSRSDTERHERHCSRDRRARPAAPRPGRDRGGLLLGDPVGPAAAAARVQRRPAAAARSARRGAGQARAGRRVPVPRLPRRRARRRGGRRARRPHRAPARPGAGRGADDARFAGILHEGLDGLSAAEVLAVPDDAPYRFGLAEAVSPLRLRGMVGMLGRIKRQVRLKAGLL